jgi:hypothetical protein
MTANPNRPRGAMTREEHEAWLKETGQYDAVLARQRQLEAARLDLEAQYQLAEAPLVDELRGAGHRVESAWDLVNTSSSYTTALPILLAHLSRPYPAAVKEGIARALAVRETKELGWDTLLRHYREEPEPRVRDGLAAAIAVAADDPVIGDVIALARDTTLGPSRVLLLSALTRSKDPRARTAITDLATDPDLVLEIRAILRRLARRKH